jgi:hypothetical protein
VQQLHEIEEFHQVSTLVATAPHSVRSAHGLVCALRFASDPDSRDADEHSGPNLGADPHSQYRF